MANGVGLSAVDPDWLGVVDHDGEDGELGGADSNGHESRLDACDIRHHLANWFTWLVESGLGDSVVLDVELKLNHAARSSSDLIRRVCQGAVVVGDLDDLDADRTSGRGRCAGCRYCRRDRRGHCTTATRSIPVLSQGTTSQKESRSQGVEEHFDRVVGVAFSKEGIKRGQILL